MCQRRIRFDNDAPTLAPLYDIRVIQPRMQLVLAYRDLPAASALDVRFQLVQVVDAKVGHADRSSLACFLGFDESTPGTEAGCLATVRGVDEDAE